MVQKKPEGQHAFRTIQKDVSSGSVKNLLLFHGDEQFLVQWSCEILKKRYINPGTEAMDLLEMDGSEADIDVIREFCETFSMFSEKKILHISDFPLLWKNSSGKYSERFANELCEYIKDLPETAIVVFTGKKEESDGKRVKQTKLFKTIKEHGSVYEFTPLDRRLLRSFIEKRVRTAGMTIKPAVTDAIVRESGYLNKDIDYDLYSLENDLKKMIAHSDLVEVTASDAAEVMTASPETNIFAMLDAVSRNRKDEALRLLWDLMHSDMETGRIIYMIVQQIELMLKTKELRSEGFSIYDISKQLGTHEYRIKKASSFADRLSEETIRNTLMNAYEISSNIKSGLMNEQLAMEYFVAVI